MMLVWLAETHQSGELVPLKLHPDFQIAKRFLVENALYDAEIQLARWRLSRLHGVLQLSLLR